MATPGVVKNGVTTIPTIITTADAVTIELTSMLAYTKNMIPLLLQTSIASASATAIFDRLLSLRIKRLWTRCAHTNTIKDGPFCQP